MNEFWKERMTRVTELRSKIIISDEMKAWIRKVDSLPMIVRSDEDLTEGRPIPETWLKLEELIGDYSEGLLLCSYNDDDVLEMLIRGNIDQEAAERMRREGHLGPADVREDGQYAKALMDLVEKAGGWVENISNLTRLEPYLKSLGFKLD